MLENQRLYWHFFLMEVKDHYGRGFMWFLMEHDYRKPINFLCYSVPLCYSRYSYSVTCIVDFWLLWNCAILIYDIYPFCVAFLQGGGCVCSASLTFLYIKIRLRPESVVRVLERMVCKCLIRRLFKNLLYKLQTIRCIKAPSIYNLIFLYQKSPFSGKF